MTQPYQQQPDPGQPYQQPAAPQQQFGPGFGPVAPQQRGGNAVLALLVAFVAAIVCAGIYAAILNATFDEKTGEVTQIGYVSVLVGAGIGATVAKLGGRNVGLWITGAALALVAVFIGEIYGYAMILSEHGFEDTSATELFFKHFGNLFDVWKEEMEAMGWVLLALAPFGAIGTAKRLGDR